MISAPGTLSVAITVSTTIVLVTSTCSATARSASAGDPLVSGNSITRGGAGGDAFQRDGVARPEKSDSSRGLFVRRLKSSCVVSYVLGILSASVGSPARLAGSERFSHRSHACAFAKLLSGKFIFSGPFPTAVRPIRPPIPLAAGTAFRWRGLLCCSAPWLDADRHDNLLIPFVFEGSETEAEARRANWCECSR